MTPATGPHAPGTPSRPAGDCPPVASAFVVGAVFAGRYRMIARLRGDAASEVWRADDLILQTPVALKVILETTPESRARIANEVRLARRITHPAVCRVFDVGEADGTVFYSMELVDGEDLATVLRRTGRFAVEKVVDVGYQVCDGLAAAHAEGVQHRNLTLSNVLLDEDGIVRMLDVGVAVPADGEMDAAPPWSPAADVYAVGVMLYELLVGQPPFPPGASRVRTPPRPSRLLPDIDRNVERTILLAMSPDPRRRPADPAAMAAALVDPAPAPRPAWRWAIVAAVVLLLAATALLTRRLHPAGAAALSNRDTLVVADVTNTTGEAVFDGTLKVALAVALEQSPFLKVLPDERVRDTLRLMQRRADERVTPAVAREIALREQSTAVVTGSIGTLGRHYVLALEAVNAQSGDVMAREQVEVDSREQVLTSLGDAVSRLRATLGESLASIQRFDVPLARATTASLDALHAYSLALDNGRVNPRVEAIPYLQRAIELDPQFALAQALLSGVYANTGRTGDAPAFSRRAFELRDRVSERERFFISWRYYIDAAQAWDQALPLAESWTRTYPREPFAFNSLGMASAAFGRHDAAVAAFETALRLDPQFVPPYGNVVGSLIALGRFDEATARLREATARHIDGASLRRAAYMLPLLRGDTEAANRALADAQRTPGMALPAVSWEAQTAAFGGRLQQAHDTWQRGVQQALRDDQREVAAQWTAQDAEAHAVAGQCGQARAEVTAAVDFSRDNYTLERAARALAVCGAATEASALAAELARRFPDATLTRQIHAPLVDALLALRRGDPARAIDRLAGVTQYDHAPSAELWPAYVRGQAYLQLKDGAGARTAFTDLLEHRGEAPVSPLYPLAALGAARAALLTGDQPAARRHFDQFFRLWAGADEGLPPLADARRAYALLQ